MVFFHCGNESIAELLVQHGADVNARARDNSTPMHAAIGSSKCSVKLIKYLIEHGGNYRLLDKEAREPLMWLEEELEHRKSRGAFTVRKKNEKSTVMTYI